MTAWQQAASENATAYQALSADLAPPDLATTHGTLGALKAITTTWPTWQAPVAHAPQEPVSLAALAGLGACVGTGLVTLWPWPPLVGWVRVWVGGWCPCGPGRPCWAGQRGSCHWRRARSPGTVY